MNKNLHKTEMVSSEESAIEELRNVIDAGNNLAEAAHRVQADHDGIHRLRLALAEWYKTRANEFGRANKQEQINLETGDSQ